MASSPGRVNARATLLGAASLCVTALLAACGGSGSSAVTNSSAFPASANRVCSGYYNKAHVLPPPIGVRQLLEYPQKQQALREQELSELKMLTAPVAERAAYKSYVSELAAVDNDSATADNRYAPAVAYLRRRQPSPSPQSLQARLVPEGSERANEAIKAKMRADVLREGDEVRSLVPRSTKSVRLLVERIARLEPGLNAEARALGLTECAKNPYTATHYSSSG
jgi:hypothetical protein